MTIDDIKHCLSVMIDCEVCEECNLYGTTGTDHCEHDCVDGALHIIDKYQKIKQIYDNWNEVNDFSYNQAMRKIGEVLEDGNVIKQESPVTPKSKSGHWILTDDDFVYCSECEDSYYPRPIDASWYYCPHCGAKMIEPQSESEET